MKNINKLEKICEHISNKEILASKAERDSIKYKQIEYLEDKVGSIFEGIISGITDWGMYVEIIENKCEGMIRYNKGYKIDIDNYQVVLPSGEHLKLGDIVNVIVKSVDIDKRQINFEFSF